MVSNFWLAEQLHGVSRCVSELRRQRKDAEKGRQEITNIRFDPFYRSGRPTLTRILTQHKTRLWLKYSIGLRYHEP